MNDHLVDATLTSSSLTLGRRIRSLTLGHRIRRIAYVVVNVSDLEKARAFYESTTPLRVIARLSAPRQKFAGLGIDEGEFEGYVLDDGSAGRPGAVHLVEWKTPKPVGAPYPVFWHVGLAKLGFGTKVPAEERLEQLKQLGISHTNGSIVRGYISFLDPDGTTVSFYQSPILSARYDHWIHINPVTTNAERSRRFFGQVLGLENGLDVTTDSPIPASQGPGSDLAQWESHLYSPLGDNRLNIDMTQPKFPAPSADTSTPYPEANHLGITRVAFEVDDIDAAGDLLRASETIGQSPGIVGPPETWDYGPEIGTRKVLCFRDPDGVRLEFVEKPPRDPATFLHFAPPAES